jgi:hypothetical protein
MITRELPKNGKFLVAFSLAGEQRDLVRVIAEAVEKELGPSTVFFDEWYEYFIAGNDADLALRRIYGAGCDLAVICVSGNYGNKPWTHTEYQAIRARFMKALTPHQEHGNYAILPIRVGEGEVEGIGFNAIVPDARKKNVAEMAQLIINRLRLSRPEFISRSSASSIGEDFWPNTPPSLNWTMADHSGAREAFSTLLLGNAPWRCLPLRGPSEVGKTHITQQMLANALHLKEPPNIACGRFDFKGTTDMDAAIRIFIQELGGITLPPPSLRLNERLSHILDALKQNARPTLLIFDTYEAASSESEAWVEKQLLPSIVRNTWLRIVIAGQRVPEHHGAVWADDASPVIDLSPPPPLDWFEYGKKHLPDLTLQEVKTFCNRARNKASLLAQLFGPTS